MKQVFAPHLGHNVKFGRKETPHGRPHLRLGNYLRAAAPAPPTNCDWTPAGASVVSDSMGNDVLGDCVIAGGYHIVGVETGNAGALFHASSAQVISDYSAIGGYNPNDPSTDQGCNLQDALNYWTSHGFANGTKLLGWAAVDPTNMTEVMQACYLFENLYFGMGLPDEWVSNMPNASGFTWDVAGADDPQNGHCVAGGGYTLNASKMKVKIYTWGLDGWLTDQAIADYAASKSGGELYVMFTPDQLAKGQTKAPNGLDWAGLIGDFDGMFGKNVPVPNPAPVPPAPNPSPTGGGVTLAQAQHAVKAAFASGAFILGRSQADKIAEKALAGISGWPT